jgi:hypothetical protein
MPKQTATTDLLDIAHSLRPASLDIPDIIPGDKPIGSVWEALQEVTTDTELGRAGFALLSAVAAACEYLPQGPGADLRRDLWYRALGMISAGWNFGPPITARIIR